MDLVVKRCFTFFWNVFHFLSLAYGRFMEEIAFVGLSFIYFSHLETRSFLEISYAKDSLLFTVVLIMAVLGSSRNNRFPETSLIFSGYVK